MGWGHGTTGLQSLCSNPCKYSHFSWNLCVCVRVVCCALGCNKNLEGKCKPEGKGSDQALGSWPAGSQREGGFPVGCGVGTFKRSSELLKWMKKGKEERCSFFAPELYSGQGGRRKCQGHPIKGMRESSHSCCSNTTEAICHPNLSRT